MITLTGLTTSNNHPTNPGATLATSFDPTHNGANDAIAITIQP